MNTNDVKKKLEDLYECIGDREALFVNYIADGNLVSSMAAGELSDIKNSFKTVIQGGMEDDAPECVTWMAKALVDAVLETVGDMILQRVLDKKDKEENQENRSESQTNGACEQDKAVRFQEKNIMSVLKIGKNEKAN